MTDARKKKGTRRARGTYYKDVDHAYKKIYSPAKVKKTKKRERRMTKGK